MNIPQDLQLGDVLLYYTKDFVDIIIAEKTGKDVGHVERYAGNGKSFASRNGIGVNEYDFRSDGLVCVRRPKGPFNFAAGAEWFKTVWKASEEY